MPKFYYRGRVPRPVKLSKDEVISVSPGTHFEASTMAAAPLVKKGLAIRVREDPKEAGAETKSKSKEKPKPETKSKAAPAPVKASVQPEPKKSDSEKQQQKKDDSESESGVKGKPNRSFGSKKKDEDTK